MEKIKGKVEEVYIPDEDIMYSTKIGFKIKANDKIIVVEQEQNDENVNILKEDEVIIKKQIISGIEFIDIEKVV